MNRNQLQKIYFKNLLPEGIILPDDITNIIDVYVNYIYDRIHLMMKEIAEEIVKSSVSTYVTIDVKISETLLDYLTNFYIETFGTHSNNFIDTIHADKLKIPNVYEIWSLPIPTKFIDHITSYILNNPIRDIDIINKCVLTIMSKHIKQWIYFDHAENNIHLDKYFPNKNIFNQILPYMNIRGLY